MIVSHEGTKTRKEIAATCRQFRQVQSGSKPSVAATCKNHLQVRPSQKYAKYPAQIAEQPSEVETAYLETVKKVQKIISGKDKP